MLTVYGLTFNGYSKKSNNQKYVSGYTLYIVLWISCCFRIFLVATIMTIFIVDEQQEVIEAWCLHGICMVYLFLDNKIWNQPKSLIEIETSKVCCIIHHDPLNEFQDPYFLLRSPSACPEVICLYSSSSYRLAIVASLCTRPKIIKIYKHYYINAH